MKKASHQIGFESSLDKLNKGFAWAKDMALSYVREGYAVGPCYEAALPGREAFCMRDVSHQALGAHFLGLAEHNRNMMRQFALNIAESRDWCSFWEVSFHGGTCPTDYTSDERFWYNLPANFDVTTTCRRLSEWTGDMGYLTDPEMSRFHEHSTHEYIKVWDRDGDGIVDRLDSDRARGVASYDEDEFNGYAAAADTLALEAAAYFDTARMYRLLGNIDEAVKMERAGAAVKDLYLDKWWDESEGRYFNNSYHDGTMGGVFTCAKAGFPLRYGLITDPEKLKSQLDYLILHTPERTIEDQTYVPEILWKYGRDDDALKLWMSFADENCPRHEYPEVSYVMIETLVTGLFGMSVSAADRKVSIRPAVGAGEWAKITSVPLWDGYVDLHVEGEKSATLTNRSGHRISLNIGQKTVNVADGESLTCNI